MLLRRDVESITEAMLHKLIEDKADERQVIDYKGMFLETDKGKDDFRIDVSSFANAQGGHIVYGMKETEGLPTELCGFEITNRDNFKLRLDDLVQTKISPRIPGVRNHVLSLENGKAAAVVHIPKSFAKPHQVQVNKEDFQFHSRNSAGKYRLNVDELRSLFVLSESLENRVRNFRMERLGKVIADDTPVRLDTSPKIVLHLIPLNAFSEPNAARFEMFDYGTPADVYPVHGFYGSRFNLDGYMTFSSGASTSAGEYLQVFRNGILESVDALILSQNDKVIPSTSVEAQYIKALPRFIKILSDLEITPPVVLMVSFLGVLDYKLLTGSSFSVGIDRNDLLFPEVLIQDFSCPSHIILRPVLDAMWTACGYPRSKNYDAEGKWIGRLS